MKTVITSYSIHYTKLYERVAATRAADPRCETLDGCLRALTSVAVGDAGITREEQALSREVTPFGAAAIPKLLPLLESEKRGVGNLAAFTLCDLNGFTEQHLDALIEARRQSYNFV